jgi:hypothetical protein
MKIELSDVLPIHDQPAFRHPVKNESKRGGPFLLFEKIPPGKRMKMTLNQDSFRGNEADQPDIMNPIRAGGYGGLLPPGETQNKGRMISAGTRKAPSPPDNRGNQKSEHIDHSENLRDPATTFSIII